MIFFVKMKKRLYIAKIKRQTIQTKRRNEMKRIVEDCAGGASGTGRTLKS
jgi:hypothetical protein